MTTTTMKLRSRIMEETNAHVSAAAVDYALCVLNIPALTVGGATHMKPVVAEVIRYYESLQATSVMENDSDAAVITQTLHALRCFQTRNQSPEQSEITAYHMDEIVADMMESVNFWRYRCEYNRYHTLRNLQGLPNNHYQKWLWDLALQVAEQRI